MERKRPNLILVHGFLCGPEYWKEQVKALSDYFTIVTICLRGFSYRGNEVAYDSIADYSNEIINEINKKGIDEFYLLGHSMGGMIVQQLAFDYPDRIIKLVLYGTGPNGSLPGRFEPLELSIKYANTQNYAHSMKKAVASWFKNREDDINFESSLQLVNKVSLTSYSNGLQVMSKWNGEFFLSHYKFPCLVIWGEYDRSYNWEEQPYKLWKGIHNSSISIANNCSHNIHLENPKMFISIIKAFYLDTTDTTDCA